MKEITRNGIYNNLKISPYKVNTDEFTFHFSSKLNLTKFKNAINFWVIDVNEKMEKKFGITITDLNLAHFLLYEKIESRGYYVTIAGGLEEVCLKELEYVGKLEKKKNSPGKFAAITNVGDVQ